MDFRRFAVTSGGEATVLTSPEAVLANMGVSPALSAAYDICDDAGVNMDRVTPLLAAAERDGRDPEAFARHLVDLVRAARGCK